MAPALAALIYPALVWAGPAVSPVLLALGLVVPAVGVVVARASVSYGPTRRIAVETPR